MKKAILLCLLLISGITGCGYTTGSLLPSRFQTIYVQPFENKIDYMSASERQLYFPQLEIRVRDAIIDRFLLDGNLKINEQDDADLVLKGQVISVDRGDLRLTNDEDVREYRLAITVALTLVDPVNEKIVWQETAFTGDTSYFTSGPNAKSESAAIQEAVNDLARRVVDRTIQDW